MIATISPALKVYIRQGMLPDPPSLMPLVAEAYIQEDFKYKYK